MQSIFDDPVATGQLHETSWRYLLLGQGNNPVDGFVSDFAGGKFLKYFWKSTLAAIAADDQWKYEGSLIDDRKHNTDSRVHAYFDIILVKRPMNDELRYTGFQTAKKMAERKIGEIVGNQHRKLYHVAAERCQRRLDFRLREWQSCESLRICCKMLSTRSPRGFFNAPSSF